MKIRELLQYGFLNRRENPIIPGTGILSSNSIVKIYRHGELWPESNPNPTMYSVLPVLYSVQYEKYKIQNTKYEVRSTIRNIKYRQ